MLSKRMTKQREERKKEGRAANGLQQLKKREEEREKNLRSRVPYCVGVVACKTGACVCPFVSPHENMQRQRETVKESESGMGTRKRG